MSDSSENDFNSIMSKVNSTPTDPSLSNPLLSTNEKAVDEKPIKAVTFIDSQHQNGNAEGETTVCTIKLPPKQIAKDLKQVVAPLSADTELNQSATSSPLSPSNDSTLVSVTLPSLTTPADITRRRRIKRRSTGIEDDNGQALSPDIFLDPSTPLGASVSPTTDSVDASFDVILNVSVR